MEDFKIPKVEPHHLWFAISGIIAALFAEFIFLDMKIIGSDIISYIGYSFFLFFITKLSIFGIYAGIFILIPSLAGYQTKRPLGIGDIDLTASIIITSFLIKDFGGIVDNWIILILLVIPIFYLSYIINKKFIPPHD